MAKISMDQIKELRKRTGVGVNYVKEALESSSGDVEKAILYLRQKGIAKAAKRSAKVTNYGYIASYVHGEGQIGILVEIGTETDFAARNEKLREVAHDIALHVAANDPQYLSIESVPEDVLNNEKAVFEKDLEGKPDNVKEKIIEGKLSSFYQQVVLLEQTYLKDESKKVKDVVSELVAAIAENVHIGRFSRIQVAGSATSGGFE
jgi:elongation factor Ts